ncbi:hypothetical protein D3C71_2118460 [compost metagenome]
MDRKRRSDRHNRSEQQLRLHLRQSNEPQLLPPVADALHVPGFEQAFVQRLQARDKG